MEVAMQQIGNDARPFLRWWLTEGVKHMPTGDQPPEHAAIAELAWDAALSAPAASPDALRVREALEAAITNGCNCVDSNNEDWHSTRCHIPLVRAALAASSGACGCDSSKGILCDEHHPIMREAEKSLIQPSGASAVAQVTGKMVQNAVGKFGADLPWCKSVANKLNTALSRQSQGAGTTEIDIEKVHHGTNGEISILVRGVEHVARLMEVLRKAGFHVKDAAQAESAHDFGTAEEVLAGLDAINAHNAALAAPAGEAGESAPSEYWIEARSIVANSERIAKALLAREQRGVEKGLEAVEQYGRTTLPGDAFIKTDEQRRCYKAGVQTACDRIAHALAHPASAAGEEKT